MKKFRQWLRSNYSALGAGSLTPSTANALVAPQLTSSAFNTSPQTFWTSTTTYPFAAAPASKSDLQLLKEFCFRYNQDEYTWECRYCDCLVENPYESGILGDEWNRTLELLPKELKTHAVDCEYEKYIYAVMIALTLSEEKK